MLNFIIGSPGAGKSHYLYNDLIEKSKNNSNDRFLILVPDQFSLEAQKEIMSMHPKHGALNIEVSSFNRMAYEVLSECGYNHLTMMDDLKKSIVIRKSLIDCKDDLNVFGRKINQSGFTEKVKSLMSELGQYNIDREVLESLVLKCDKKPSLKNKIEDIIVIKDAIEQYIDRNNLTSEELLNMFMQVIDDSAELKRTHIYLDGYTGFTPIQVEVIGKLMSQVKAINVAVTLPLEEKVYTEIKEEELFNLSKTTITKLSTKAEEAGIEFNTIELADENGRPYRIKDNESLSFLVNNIFRGNNNTFEEAQDSVQIIESNRPETEVVYIAQTITNMVLKHGYKYGDFAVICPSMENYYKSFNEVFAKYNIPKFIDHKRSTAVNLFMDFVLSLIRVVEYNFEYNSLFHLLRLGLTDIDDDDLNRIENYALIFKRTSINSFSHEWKKTIYGLDIDNINKTRETIYNLLKDFYRKMTSASNIKDYCLAIYEILEQWDISAKIEAYIEAFKEQKQYELYQEYSQIYSAIIKLLDSMVETLGDEKLSIEDFENLVLAATDTLKIGIIPPGVDDVMIGDIERTRLKDTKKYIFLVGATEGTIPSIANTATIINDSDREELKKYDIELAPTTMNNVFKQQFYLYTLMGKPVEKFIITYPLKDNAAESVKKSYLIDEIRSMYPLLEIKKEYEKEPSAKDIVNKKVALEYLANHSMAYRNKDMTDEELDLYNSIYGVLVKDKECKPLVDSILNGTYYVYVDQNLDSNIAKDLYGDKLIKVTRAQTHAECPYRQFLNSGIKLHERDKYELSSIDVGILEHNVMEQFFKNIDERDLFDKQKNVKDFDQMIEKIITDEIEKMENEFINTDSLGRFTRVQLTDIAKESTHALINQLRKGEFRVGNLEKMGNSGVADRIDYYRDDENVFVKVIDYKTGNVTFRLNEVIAGINMQAFLYLKDAVDLERNNPDNANKRILPAGAYYFILKNHTVNKRGMSPDKELDDVLAETINSEYQLRGLTNVVCSSKMGNMVEGEGELIKTKSNPNNVVKVATRNTQIYEITETQYEGLLNYVEDKLESIRTEISDGIIKADPYTEGYDSCKNCKYKSICNIDMCFKEGRVLKDITKDDLDEIIEEKND